MKITSEICTKELDARFPVSMGDNRGGWKRLSKKGNSASGIVRVFAHRKLPVTGTVIERDGVIVTVEFATNGSSGSSSPRATVERPAVAPAKKPASNGQVSADQFLFAILNCRDGGVTHFVVCQIDFWQQHRHLSDDVNRQTLEGLLPENTDEETESSFFSNSLKKRALREFMLGQGFKEDPQFTDYIVDIW